MSTLFYIFGKNGGHKDLQAHTHAQRGEQNRTISTGGGQWVAGLTTNANVGNTASTGTGDSGNLQPYQVANYIIKS